MPGTSPPRATDAVRASRAPAIAWTWRNALFALVAAAPAVLVTVFDPASGLALGVGVLPAIAVGVLPRRRQRVLLLIAGAVAGASMFVGSLVANTPVLAVVTVFVLCVVLAVAATNPMRRLLPAVLNVGPALVGAGLSESGPVGGATMGLLILSGSVFVWLLSLLWPDRPAPPARDRAPLDRATMFRYGLQIGAAGAAAAALGFASGVDHPGWACAAALLVSRPDDGLLRSRAWGRAVAVVVGALVACTVAATTPTSLALAVVLALTLMAVGGTRGSRWYVTPAFSTTIVLSMLMVGQTGVEAHWFLERVGQTLVGVALALLALGGARLLTRSAGPGPRYAPAP